MGAGLGKESSVQIFFQQALLNCCRFATGAEFVTEQPRDLEGFGWMENFTAKPIGGVALPVLKSAHLLSEVVSTQKLNSVKFKW